MRKFLLITFALIGLAQPVEAAPVLGAITSIVSWFSGLTGFAAIAAKLGASFILNSIANALIGKRGFSQQDIIRELQQPTSLAVYRFVYGKCWAPGSPAPVRVKGEFIYACYLLNSRPSAGPFTVYLDKRKVLASGNPYDFAGPGAQATEYPFDDHCQYWIGRGEQTAPPDLILNEAPEYYKSTDAWRGRTVIWFKLGVGGNDKRQERWPATPPEVMVDGRWSLVRDPRTPAAAASWSANQALCVLDALRENPLRPYDDRNIWLETFAWAADVADEAFPVKGGGTIPKFEINGVLAFSAGSELEDQIIPLANAGASRLIRSGGRIGLIPAVYQAPMMTITDVLDDQPMTFDRYRPSSELVTEVTAQYVSPDRAYEDAETPVYKLAGAQAEDGGLPKRGKYDLRFVTDHRQGQYVAAILGRRTRMQRSWSGMLPGTAFDLVACSTVRLSLPPPYTNRSGIYEVETIHPGFDPIGLEGMAMRCPAVLRETSPSIYAWNPTIDERPVQTGEFDPGSKPVSPPGAISLTSNETTALASGDNVHARVLIEFAPSVSPSVISYEWQYSKYSLFDERQLWQSGGSVNAEIRNDNAQVFAYLQPVSLNQKYVVRVRAVAPGRTSAWVKSGDVTVTVGDYSAPPPTPVSATGGSGQIAVTFRAPNNENYRGLEIHVSTTKSAIDASLLFGPIYGSANSTVTKVHDGLQEGVTRWYFARSLDRFGSYSPLGASVSATTS